jgi:hypothetical protein
VCVRGPARSADHDLADFAIVGGAAFEPRTLRSVGARPRIPGFDAELEEPPTQSADAMDPGDVALYVGNLLAAGLASALTTALLHG